jgi:hypothetical protein
MVVPASTLTLNTGLLADLAFWMRCSFWQELSTQTRAVDCVATGGLLRQLERPNEGAYVPRTRAVPGFTEGVF